MFLRIKLKYLKLFTLKKIFILAFTVFSFFKAFSQETYVFFGSFNWDKNTNGIYVYQLNPTNGKLSKVTALKNIVNPSFLTLSKDGKFVFACTESKTPDGGSVSSFQFDPKVKSLKFINSQKSGGENPVYLTTHNNGKWLVNGNYTEGSISVYPISEEGIISPLVQNFQFIEGSINAKRQDRAHIHSTVFSPDFNYLFAPDLGADKIRLFTFNADQKEPLQVAQNPSIATVAGSGPRHFTFHPNGKFAYCIEEMGGAVSVYHYENGHLENLQIINTHPDEYKADFESSDVHISHDGRFLYASNRGQENNIAIFSIQVDGTLKTVGYQATLGKHPRIFAIDETGDFLITTNVQTSDVFVFRRNQETGLLTKIGKRVKIKNVSSVLIKNY